MANIYNVCKEKFEDNYSKDKKYCKFRHQCHYTGEYRGDAYGICNLKYSIQKKKKFVWCFAVDQTMIILLSEKN